MTLTANQKQALSEIQAGRITMRNTGHGSWRIFGPCHPSVVGRVIALGFAKWAEDGDRKVAVLTTPQCFNE